MSRFIILISLLLIIIISTIAYDCSQEIKDTINIVKNLQPICHIRDITCIHQNERDIAKITGEMNFKCFMKAKAKAIEYNDYEQCIKKDGNSNNKK